MIIDFDGEKSYGVSKIFNSKTNEEVGVGKEIININTRTGDYECLAIREDGDHQAFIIDPETNELETNKESFGFPVYVVDESGKKHQ